MTEEALLKKVDRLVRRVDLLEAMIEDRAREIYVANEKARRFTEFLSEIYRTLPSALFVFDTEGVIEVANAAAASLLGYSEAALIGMPLTRVFDPSDPISTSEIKARTQGGGIWRAEKTCITKAGKHAAVLFSATLLDQDGTPKFVGVALDIQEQKVLEIGLRQAQKLESVGRLASGVAHEINTPVQFISDSIHFVRDAVKDGIGAVTALQKVRALVLEGAPAIEAAERAAEAEDDADFSYLIENIPKALERALDGLDRVATIVRSMKDFAHPDQKDMIAVDLNRGIESTLVIARNEYKYVADLDVELGPIPHVLCHAGDINQAILNIVVNAAHAIEEKEAGTGRRGRIGVRTRVEGAHVCVAISDTGPGIPDALRDRIFDPFFTTKAVGKGTGQGLSIARAVLERHGGELAFETLAGEGTTFFLRIPIAGAETRKEAVA